MNVIERSRTIKKLFDGYREEQAYKSGYYGLRKKINQNY
ncbi:hypothetical protein GMNKNHGO_00086 [Enterococcus phage vB_Efa29212_3e]|uniref:Uncharacterized protein n=1 Tax=Enterococcus phage vB_Efa29212_3e TaxID=2982224 RepID=A0A978CXU3_9CAUD|nr:hypothetical protein GMNKNHGO_00086 [Enterococcus phage vB_Efa29212_3e]